MDAELKSVIQILKRWFWLILSCLLIAGIAAGVAWHRAEPTYRARAALQFSSPDRGDVELIDEYRYVSDREETVLAMNNFVRVAESRDVQAAADQELTPLVANGAYELGDYTMDVRASVDDSFVQITAEAGTPEAAAAIANAYAQVAIRYFGEWRAQPARSTQAHFAEQLQQAEEAMRAAESRLNAFRTEHAVTLLDADIELQRTMLEQLQLEQGRLRAENPVRHAATIVQIDDQIADVRSRLGELVQLEPQYNRLNVHVEQARETYQLLLNKAREADLKEDLAQAVHFVQVVEPALPPEAPTSNTNRVILLAILGSLGLGIVLAFISEYVRPSPKSQSRMSNGLDPTSVRVITPPLGNHATRRVTEPER